MKTRSQLQTMAVAYAEICQGEDPWVALGNFMHDWFDFARDRREQLVMDPLEEPELPSTKLQRWAAFCAASVEWLCQRYHVPCPAWVHAPAFVLPHPWWYVPQKKVRAWVIHATPEPFTRRNIFCGDRMFLNKYEFAEQARLVSLDHRSSPSESLT